MGSDFIAMDTDYDVHDHVLGSFSDTAVDLEEEGALKFEGFAAN